MTLDLNDDDARDLQNIVMFALRYAQGRKTYAFSLVSSWLIAHADIMQPWQLKKMGEEIEDDVGLWWQLSDLEKAEYIGVANKLKELAEDDGIRESVRVKHE